MVRALLNIAAAAALAGCEGWEGPGNWLDEGYEAGASASACRGADQLPDGRFPKDVHLNTGFSNWEGRVRGQAAECVVHTDPLNASKAAWVNCRVDGPAVITHSPPIGDKEIFLAGPGTFELRMNKRGLTCRPVAPG
jgi:hypothetical protein